jgi:hypothetical protein
MLNRVLRVFAKKLYYLRIEGKYSFFSIKKNPRKLGTKKTVLTTGVISEEKKIQYIPTEK